jgi:hypothetical protein
MQDRPAPVRDDPAAANIGKFVRATLLLSDLAADNRHASSGTLA